MTRPLREARISSDAIAANTATIAARVAPAAVLAVVKAGGYGHGAVAAARAAVEGGAGWLGVVDLAEAFELRAAGLAVPVLAWLHGDSMDFSEAIAASVDIGVGTAEQLEAAAASSGTALVHLKIDTGLGRNGVPEADCEALFARARELERAGAVRVRGIFSHLANAGAEEDAAQLAVFERALASASAAGLEPEVRHLAATAAALRLPAARYDLVRVGIGLYGLSPFDDATSAELGLVPAMELGAAVASVKRVPAGHGVSYSYTYRTATETTLALVPLGYADGVPRSASSRGPVWINGRTYPVAGRVAMDQVVVDVGDDAVGVGDRAVLFGDPALGYPSAEDWAEAAGTINYEIVTRIGPRVPRTVT